MQPALAETLKWACSAIMETKNEIMASLNQQFDEQL